jgi:hypothetical protein
MHAANLATAATTVHSRFARQSPSIVCGMRARLPLLVLALAALPATALSQSWRTAQQAATWVNLFIDAPMTERTALWFDGHWRRMGLGAEPQQLLLRPGAQFTVRPGLRVGAGYAFIATAPYGEVPLARPAREHRGWQQISLSHRVGRHDVTHRLRAEQRWVASLLADDAPGPFSYQQRARYSVRSQRPLRTSQDSERALLAFAWNEFFLPIGHADARLGRIQNRVGAGLGVPFEGGRRLEVGYMHQWTRVTPSRTHEINHTLVLSLVHAGRR